MKKLILLVAGCLVMLWTPTVQAQEEVLPETSEFKDPKTRVWFNTYGNLRISKRLYWDAQTHLGSRKPPIPRLLGKLGKSIIDTP